MISLETIEKVTAVVFGILTGAVLIGFGVFIVDAIKGRKKGDQ